MLFHTWPCIKIFNTLTGRCSLKTLKHKWCFKNAFMLSTFWAKKKNKPRLQTIWKSETLINLLIWLLIFFMHIHRHYNIDQLLISGSKLMDTGYIFFIHHQVPFCALPMLFFHWKHKRHFLKECKGWCNSYASLNPLHLLFTTLYTCQTGSLCLPNPISFRENMFTSESFRNSYWCSSW